MQGRVMITVVFIGYFVITCTIFGHHGQSESSHHLHPDGSHSLDYYSVSLKSMMKFNFLCEFKKCNQSGQFIKRSFIWGHTYTPQVQSLWNYFINLSYRPAFVGSRRLQLHATFHRAVPARFHDRKAETARRSCCSHMHLSVHLCCFGHSLWWLLCGFFGKDLWR